MKQYTILRDGMTFPVTMEHKVIYDEILAMLSKITMPKDFDYNKATPDEIISWREARQSSEFITEVTTKRIIDRLIKERKEMNNE